MRTIGLLNEHPPGEIPASHRDLAQCPPVAALTTVTPGGYRQTSVVWCDFDGQCLRVNTMRGFAREQNMRRNPRVTLLCYDPCRPLRCLEVRGMVAEMTLEGLRGHKGPTTLVARPGSLYMGVVEASPKDWLGGRQFDVDRYLHGATLEETVATGVYCLVTGKRRDSNVYFVQSGGTWVLVDTAWRGRAELIRSAAETLFGAGARPRAIVLTHVHPDHAGSASELARMWDVTVYVHPGELPLPPSGRIIGALAGVERRWMFPSGQGGLSPIDPDVGVPGLPDWQVIPTPGHTPGHLALFREADRALIAGDAVLTVNLNSLGDALSQRHTLGGPPRVATWNWRAATESVSELARLEPGVLAPGHGRPMAGPVLAPALRALGEQLSNPASAGSAGSSAGHKLTEWVLNFFDYSRRAR